MAVVVWGGGGGCDETQSTRHTRIRTCARRRTRLRIAASRRPPLRPSLLVRWGAGGAQAGSQWSGSVRTSGSAARDGTMKRLWPLPAPHAAPPPPRRGCGQSMTTPAASPRTAPRSPCSAPAYKRRRRPLAPPTALWPASSRPPPSEWACGIRVPKSAWAEPKSGSAVAGGGKGGAGRDLHGNGGVGGGGCRPAGLGLQSRPRSSLSKLLMAASCSRWLLLVVHQYGLVEPS